MNDKVIKTIKICFLIILSLIAFYNTYTLVLTWQIVFKNQWFLTSIYPLFDFIYDIVNVLSYYLLAIILTIYFFYKNKIKKNNDFIQGVRYLGILIGIGLIIYTSYLTIYDIRNLLFIKEEVLYGDTIFNIGFTSIFVYLTWNLKKYLFEDKKLSKGLFIGSGVLIIVGLLINMYLVSIY